MIYSGTINLVNKVDEIIGSKYYTDRGKRDEIINSWALKYKSKFFEMAIHIIPNPSFGYRKHKTPKY